MKRNEKAINLDDIKNIVKDDTLSSKEKISLISDEALFNKDNILKLLDIDPFFLEYTSEELKSDYDVVNKAVSIDGYTIAYANDKLKDNRNLVMLAMQTAGDALQFVSTRLKDDIDVVRLAVQNEPLSLSDASERLRDDKDLVLSAINKNGYAIRFASDNLKDDKELAIIAVTNSGLAFNEISESLKNDRDVVINAILNNPMNLSYVNEDFKNDKDIITKAVSVDGRSLKYASDNLKKDKEIVKLAIFNKPVALEYASAELQKNKDFVYLQDVCFKTSNPFERNIYLLNKAHKSFFNRVQNIHKFNPYSLDKNEINMNYIVIISNEIIPENAQYKLFKTPNYGNNLLQYNKINELLNNYYQNEKVFLYQYRYNIMKQQFEHVLNGNILGDIKKVGIEEAIKIINSYYTINDIYNSVNFNYKCWENLVDTTQNELYKQIINENINDMDLKDKILLCLNSEEETITKINLERLINNTFINKIENKNNGNEFINNVLFKNEFKLANPNKKAFINNVKNILYNTLDKNISFNYEKRGTPIAIRDIDSREVNEALLISVDVRDKNIIDEIKSKDYYIYQAKGYYYDQVIMEIKNKRLTCFNDLENNLIIVSKDKLPNYEEKAFIIPKYEENINIGKNNVLVEYITSEVSISDYFNKILPYSIKNVKEREKESVILG